MKKRMVFAAVAVAGVAWILSLTAVCGCRTTCASEGEDALSVAELREAAKNGDAAAQYSLGCRYYKGNGVEKDMSEAVKWLRKAAEQGNASAQYNLGLCYAIGKGVRKSSKEAGNWFRKAAEQGIEPAKQALELMKMLGE